MLESMLPFAERQVLTLGRKLNRINAQMGDIEGSNRGHLNLPERVAEAYRVAYRKTRIEFDETRIALQKAIRVAESYSPGCASGLLALAKSDCWKK